MGNIFDLGDGTIDVSFLQADHGVFQVKITDGNAHFRVENLDKTLVEFCVKQTVT